LLQIWGREYSLSVQKVMWCVRELGIPYGQIDMGKGYGWLDQSWYLKMKSHGGGGHGWANADVTPAPFSSDPMTSANGEATCR